MRKGFVFSLDAAAAIVLVIVLAGAVAAYHFSSGSEGRVFGSIKEKASDEATVNFYLGQGSTQDSLAGKEFGYCTIAYDLNPDEGAGRSSVGKEQFCEEI